MSCYGTLAQWYDSFTRDVPYKTFADYYEAEFARSGGEFRLLLDLCCGTGTLSCEMAERGYDMIAVDMSEDMLMMAREKAMALTSPPLFLCQDAQELDLYGTVDACYCSLDGINYLSEDELNEVFRRLRLFIRPGGLFIFDIRDPEYLRSLDGQVFVDENEDALCLWRSDFYLEENAIVYGMDIFERRGELWQRSQEEHVEYAHSYDALNNLLTKHGFVDIILKTDGPQHDMGRFFISARRGE